MVVPDLDPTPGPKIEPVEYSHLPEPTGAETDPGAVARSALAERLAELKKEGTI